jgi:hypothetical protein
MERMGVVGDQDSGRFLTRIMDRGWVASWGEENMRGTGGENMKGEERRGRRRIKTGRIIGEVVNTGPSRGEC